MFDDPKKELNRLDSELRAESYEDELEQLVNQKLPDLDNLLSDDDMRWLKDIGVLDNNSPEPRPSRNRRNDAQDFRRTVFADETMDEDAAVFVEKKKAGETKKSKNKKKESKGVGCLPYIIFMELLGIGGMLWWWFRWLH